MSTVIDLDAAEPETVVLLPRLGSLNLQRLPAEVTSRVLRRPLQSSPMLTTDQLLALSAGITSGQARDLSDRDRARLRLAVVRENGWGEDWKSLRGSFLSPDERLVACAVWGTSIQRRFRVARLVALQRGLSVPDAKQLTPQLSASMRNLKLQVDGMARIQKLMDPLRSVRRATDPLRVWQTQSALTKSLLGPDLGSTAALRGLKMPGLSVQTVSSLNVASAAGLRGLKTPALPVQTFASRIKFPESVIASMPPGGYGLGARVAAPAGLMRDVADFRLAAGVVGRPIFPNGVMDAIVQAQSAGALAGVGAALNRQQIAAAASWKASLEALVRPLSAFTVPSVFEKFQPDPEILAAEVFWDAWENDPLWFVIAELGYRQLRPLLDVKHGDVEAVVLGALEAVVRDERFTGALRQIVREANELPESTRGHLGHALEHAQKGEWLHAVPSLYVGYEGALHHIVVQRNLPVRAGKFEAAEILLKKAFSDEGHVIFVVQKFLGGAGNSHRHGRALDGEREVLLSGVVALVRLLDELLGIRGMEVLIACLVDRLPAAAAAAPSKLIEA